jgi:hypothetical protein
VRAVSGEDAGFGIDGWHGKGLDALRSGCGAGSTENWSDVVENLKNCIVGSVNTVVFEDPLEPLSFA